jgi:trans-2,3-dihydro-3-hydroxyanthranilate isomerase
MPTYPFMQVDAFTTRPLTGNPCAVLLDADGLDDPTMLAIAREMNLSETAFVCRSSVADFRVRYFTPAEEIPLAGHPTIATAFALWKAGRLALKGDHTTITLELKVGPLPVELHASGGIVEQIVMTQKKPVFLKTYDPAQVLPLFGLTAADVLPGVPIQTVSTGTPQLMLPLRSHDSLRRVEVNAAAYARFRAVSDFFSAHLFCLGGVTPAGQTFARHFVAPPDLLEDPITGSATGGMGAYLWHYGLIKAPVFVAEQGHWMSHPGSVSVEVIGAPQDIQTVKIGGAAVVVIQGQVVL